MSGDRDEDDISDDDEGSTDEDEWLLKHDMLFSILLKKWIN